jgi:hypothetical protein
MFRTLGDFVSRTAWPSIVPKHDRRFSSFFLSLHQRCHSTSEIRNSLPSLPMQQQPVLQDQSLAHWSMMLTKALSTESNTIMHCELNQALHLKGLLICHLSRTPTNLKRYAKSVNTLRLPHSWPWFLFLASAECSKQNRAVRSIIIKRDASY